MTVLKKPSYIMEDILGGKNPLVMILEDLQDPGNAGTILRTGEGAGVSGVLLTKTCVDITWVLSTECLSYMWKVWYH